MRRKGSGCTYVDYMASVHGLVRGYGGAEGVGRPRVDREVHADLGYVLLVHRLGAQRDRPAAMRAPSPHRRRPEHRTVARRPAVPSTAAPSLEAGARVCGRNLVHVKGIGTRGGDHAGRNVSQLSLPVPARRIHHRESARSHKRVVVAVLLSVVAGLPIRAARHKPLRAILRRRRRNDERPVPAAAGRRGCIFPLGQRRVHELPVGVPIHHK